MDNAPQHKQGNGHTINTGRARTDTPATVAERARAAAVGAERDSLTTPRAHTTEHSSHQTPPPTRQSQQTETQEVVSGKKRPAVRTYYSDIARTVQKRNVSMTDIALAETRRAQSVAQTSPDETPTEEKTERRWSRVALWLGILLLLGGGGIFAFISFSYAPRQAHPVFEPLHTTLITPDEEQLIDVTGRARTALIETITDQSETLDGPPGTLVSFVPVVTTSEEQIPLSARAFLEQLETHADAAFLRSVQDDFAFGVHLFDDERAFLLLKVDFFENAFAGILRWETFLADDLPFLTTPEIRPTLSEPATTTTPISTLQTILQPTSEPIFKDIVVENRDARALISPDTGHMHIVYAFPDTQTLIITSKQDTLTALFERLRAVQRQ